MLIYNLLIALYLGYLGTVAHVAGSLLWPAVALHAGVAAALLWTGRHQRSPTTQLRACLLACVLAAATPAMAQTGPQEPTAEARAAPQVLINIPVQAFDNIATPRSGAD
jgi:hypothetical protein